MTGSRRIKRKLRLLACMFVVGALAGIGYGVYLSYAARFELTPLSLAKAGLHGAILLFLWWAFQTYLVDGPVGAPLRRLPFAVRLVAVASGSTAVIVAGLFLGVPFDRYHALDSWFPYNFLRDLAFVLVLTHTVHFVLQVRRIVGGRVLANLVLGRYHRPVREERIFLFLDLVDSTALAEKLGEIGVYSMISRFFFDLAEPIAEFGGEIHRYIGDAVVVTWPLEDGVRDALCLRCYFAICDRIEARAEAYERDFHTVPRFRAGLHGGPVVAGECGDDKQEIAYFGDTVNTAARIEQACKRLDRPFLVSRDLLEQMELPAEYEAESLGDILLPGREHWIELISVERARAGRRARQEVQ